MNLVVLTKRVPDTETKIQVKDGKVVTDGISWIISPYDEYGIEEAQRMIESMAAKSRCCAWVPLNRRRRFARDLRSARMRRFISTIPRSREAMLRPLPKFWQPR